MALREKAATQPTTTGPVPDPTSVGKFEAMDESVTQTPAANEPELTGSNSKEITNTVSHAVAVPPAVGSDIRCTLEQMRDQIGLDIVESLGIGAFPRVTVGLDGFSIKDGADLGKKIKIEVDSWNYVWLVTTGENSSAETNKLIRTSYDGVNLKGGEGTIEAYLNKLKDVEGYKKASVRQYVEMYGDLLWSEEKGEVAVEDRKTVQVSLSPQSVVQMSAFFVDSRKRKRKGIEDGNVVFLTQEKKVLGATKFGLATFSTK
jgi:hypothetical protein